MRLHQWLFATDAWNQVVGRDGGARTPDSDVVRATVANIGDPTLEPVEVRASPAVTHIRYRVG